MSEASLLLFQQICAHVRTRNEQAKLSFHSTGNMSPWRLPLDPYLPIEGLGAQASRPPTARYEDVFRPQEPTRLSTSSSQREHTYYPFLASIAAIRAADSTRQALSLDVVAEAFEEQERADHENNTHASDSGRTTIPADPDEPDFADVDAFGTELKRRVAELGDRALETRELAKYRDRIQGLCASAPSSSAARQWVESAAQELRRTSCAVANIDRTQASDDADEILREMRFVQDQVDSAVEFSLERLESLQSCLSDKLKSNYEWVRRHSALLGLQCSSSVRCPVCLVNTVTMFIDPCGHTFCEECVSRCSDDECCVCRAPMRCKRKLFWCG